MPTRLQEYKRGRSLRRLEESVLCSDGQCFLLERQKFARDKATECA